MIYDDQPQMVEAAAEAAHEPKYPTHLPSGAKYVLRGAFAAIDREALIEKATPTTLQATMDAHGFRGVAEKILIAAGIIPERKQRPDPDGMPQSERWGH